MVILTRSVVKRMHRAEADSAPAPTTELPPELVDAITSMVPAAERVKALNRQLRGMRDLGTRSLLCRAEAPTTVAEWRRIALRLPNLERLRLESQAVVVSRALALPGAFRSLTHLDISGCSRVRILDLRHLRHLRHLACNGCHQLRELRSRERLERLVRLECLECVRLRSLDLLATAPNLVELSCSFAPLRQLDLAAVPGLEVLELSDCGGIPSLQLHGVPQLTRLVCEEMGTRIGALDLQHVPRLRHLAVGGTSSVGALELRHVPHLEHLDCSETGVKVLDLSCVPGLTHLDCSNCFELEQLTGTVAAVPALRTLVLDECMALDPQCVVLRSLTIALQDLMCDAPRDLADADLGHLKGLTSLRCSSLTMPTMTCLRSMPGLKCLHLGGSGGGGGGGGGVPKWRIEEQLPVHCLTELEDLNLYNCQGLTVLDLAAMPRLRLLGICNLDDLTTLNLPRTSMHLMDLYVYKCGKLQWERGILDLTGMPKLYSATFEGVPRLRTVRLGDAPSLESFRCTIASLQRLQVGSAPKLEYIELLGLARRPSPDATRLLHARLPALKLARWYV